MTIDINEFQADEDVTDEFEPPKRRSGIVVSVRLNPTDADRLLIVAEASGRTISQVTREAIDSYLEGRARPAVSDGMITILTSEPMTVIQSSRLTSFTLSEPWAAISLPPRSVGPASSSRRVSARP